MRESMALLRMVWFRLLLTVFHRSVTATDRSVVITPENVQTSPRHKFGLFSRFYSQPSSSRCSYSRQKETVVNQRCLHPQISPLGSPTMRPRPIFPFRTSRSASLGPLRAQSLVRCVAAHNSLNHHPSSITPFLSP